MIISNEQQGMVVCAQNYSTLGGACQVWPFWRHAPTAGEAEDATLGPTRHTYSYPPISRSVVGGLVRRGIGVNRGVGVAGVGDALGNVQNMVRGTLAGEEPKTFWPRGPDFRGLPNTYVYARALVYTYMLVIVRFLSCSGVRIPPNIPSISTRRYSGVGRDKLDFGVEAGRSAPSPNGDRQMTTTKHNRLELARQIANGTRCYDCGSTIPGHHTELCDMAGDGDRQMTNLTNNERKALAALLAGVERDRESLSLNEAFPGFSLNESDDETAEASFTSLIAKLGELA